MISGTLVRQAASARDTNEPNSGAAHQNPDGVIDALAEAAAAWSETRDPAELRRRLGDIIEALETE